MDYSQACAFLWSLPTGRGRVDLSRTRALLSRLGNPQAAMAIAHVAGTKGKGSTCAMLASILGRSRRRTGLFTSPHLHSVRERIAIDGTPVGHESFAEAITAVAEVMDGSCSPFEALTAAALWAFANQGVELAVIEVGLGGRLDPTNVVTPFVSVITSISYDHTQVLGDSLAQIAAEKAGIIKPGVPVISAGQAAEPAAVLAGRASALNCAMQSVGTDWRYTGTDAGGQGQRFALEGPARPVPLADGCYALPLLGEHQVQNAALALAAAELSAPSLGLDADDLRAGIGSVCWPGRLEVMGRRPLVVVDGAHNVDSLTKLLAALDRHFHVGRLRLVFGASAEKDIGGMLRVAGTRATLYACTSSGPRAAAAGDVLAAGVDVGMRGLACTSVADALWQAVAEAGEDDCVCVAGSLYVVAAAREAWARRHGQVRESYGEVEVISLRGTRRK